MFKVFTIVVTTSLLALSVSSCTSTQVSLCNKYSMIVTQLDEDAASGELGVDPGDLNEILKKETGSISTEGSRSAFAKYFSKCLSNQAVNALKYADCTEKLFGMPMRYDTRTWKVYHDSLLGAGCISE